MSKHGILFLAIIFLMSCLPVLAQQAESAQATFAVH